MTKEEILEIIETEDVEFIRLQFTDIFGNLKNVAVPARNIERVMDNKFIFDASSIYDKYRVGEEEMHLYPDLDTFVILPWRPQQGKVARLICDVYDINDEPFEMCSRTILKRTLKKAHDEGYKFYIDPECEFFLFHTDEKGVPTTVMNEDTGLMSVGPNDLGENARREIVLSLEKMGFEIEASYHETAPSQHEIDFKEGEALQIADSITTLKQAVRCVSKSFGLHATFMPKPKNELPGSGMHLNFSVYKDDRNIFNFMNEEKEMKDEARWFIGGVLKYAPQMCVFTNPLTNSYKRLIKGFEAPTDVVWSMVHTNPAVKIWNRPSEDNKMEVRFPDPSANPYISIALCIAAGMEGIKNKIEPGEPVLKNYNEDDVDVLPVSLFEAARFAKNSKFINDVVGENFAKLYIGAKKAESEEYMKQVTDWERRNYLTRV